MCCTLNPNSNNRALCGAFYNVSVVTGPVEVRVTLRTSALVNELITAWNNPCSDKPRRYDVFYGAGNNYITTSDESDCISAPGT